MASAALIHGSYEHHLDHLAPLAVSLGIPLIVTEELLENSARKYYPEIQIRTVDHTALPFTLIREFETIFTALPRPLITEIVFFAETLLNKKLQTIWVPHGNSDKGHLSYHMEALKEESIALVYGKKMIDFLKKKGAFDQLEQCIEVGNFRREFATKYSHFYQPLVEREIFAQLDANNPTILFAPTWEDAENSSSISQAQLLFDTLPSDFNLIIKPHPNLRWQRENLFFGLQKRKNFLVLNHFPPIYPLLEKIDIYLGDTSSIGYDFLAFNRPMFFFNPTQRDPVKDEGLFLFRCGTELPWGINPYDLIREKCAGDSAFHALRQEVYTHTFGQGNLEQVCKTVLHET